jgi:hypothetical protein
MPNFDDILKKAAEIAKEEGLFADDGTREILPSPGKVKRQGEIASRVADRLKKEQGVDLTDVAKALSQGGASSPAQPRLSPPKLVAEDKPLSDAEPTKQRHSNSTVDLDDVIQEQVDVLEAWVKYNEAQAKRDFMRFWAFKIPAIACSVSVAAFESLGFGVIVIVLGVISAFCVGIDALFPGGRLHNVHKRAANEARRLQHDAIARWRQAQLGKNSDRRQAVSTILDFIQTERSRIDKYVTDAESSLGVTDSSK